MVFIKSADGVIFADENLEKVFNSLPENDSIKKSIVRAIKSLKEDAFCGERIRKELIPKTYIQKYNIDNLLWYPLPDGWRLVYSIQRDEVELLAVILEWFDHKNYERRFGY
jgi:Txe/YoeB family toxin of Txe-Axe toxin-antitoxin module